jgi:ADP-heptose:LPS heptosyltransferase
MNLIKEIIKTLLAIGICCIDSIVLSYVKSHNVFVSRHLKKQILLIRLDAIGDAVLWLDSFRFYKKIFPEETHEITLLCNYLWYDLVCKSGYANRYIPIDRLKFKGNLKYRYRLLKELIANSPDIVINTAFSRQLLVDDSAVRFTCATERIGQSGNLASSNRILDIISRRWYTTLHKSSDKQLMELDRNIVFIKMLGITNAESSLPDIVLPVQMSVYKEPYYIVFPGASSRKKQWPIENVRLLIDKIYTTIHIPALICGSNAEKHLGIYLSNACLQNAIVDKTGSTSIVDLYFLIKNARFLISNDTSAIHIAAAAGTPAICTLAGGHYGRFLPYKVDNLDNRPLPIVLSTQMPCFGCDWKCIYKTKKYATWPCLARITVDDVWNAIVTNNFLNKL